MLTRFLSVSVASSLQEMPRATSSHSGLAGSCDGGKTGSLPVSSAIRCASGPHRDADGRSTLVGQETKNPLSVRNLFISSWQCRQTDILCSQPTIYAVSMDSIVAQHHNSHIYTSIHTG